MSPSRLLSAQCDLDKVKAVSDLAKRRAWTLGYAAYLDGHCKNPWAPNGQFPSRGKRCDLAYEFSEGYDDAEKDARAELRHIHSERTAYFARVL